MSYIGIDYMQYSVELEKAPLDNTSEFEPIRNRFYNQMARNAWGASIMIGNPNSDKALVVCTGKACERIFSTQTPREYIDNALGTDAKFSRIDIQCTTANSDKCFATVKDVITSVYEGRMQTTFGDKTVKFIASMGDVNYDETKVETAYIGSMSNRGKTGIFRAYDKGLESGLQSDFLTRYEVEWRKDSAHSQAKRVAIGWHLSEIMDNRIHFDSAWWYAALDNETSDALDIMRGNAKPEDDVLTRASYWQWALKTARGIGKKIALENASDEFLAAIVEELVIGMKSQL